MWNIAYDYVRLHQPHPMFTVGNMKWNWQRPRDYLAARDEVQSHLSSALGLVGDKVALKTSFGQTVATCEEVETSQGAMAELTFHPNGLPNTQKTIRANRASQLPNPVIVALRPFSEMCKAIISRSFGSRSSSRSDHSTITR